MRARKWWTIDEIIADWERDPRMRWQLRRARFWLWRQKLLAKIRVMFASLAVLLLAGCNLIPTAAQQGGIDSMFHCITYDEGKKTGEFWLSRDAIDRNLNFESLEINEPAGKTDKFSPCRVLVEGYEREQGDASLTGQALQIEAARQAALIGAFMQLIQTNPGLLQGLGGGGQ